MNTAHFNEVEFKCRCGGCESIKPSSELLAVLELVRLRFRAPVVITSGYRCPTHNKNVGGSPASRHMKGDAADIHVKGVPPKVVTQFVLETFPNSYGIAEGKSFTHIDTRPVKARWQYPGV